MIPSSLRREIPKTRDRVPIKCSKFPDLTRRVFFRVFFMCGSQIPCAFPSFAVDELHNSPVAVVSALPVNCSNVTRFPTIPSNALLNLSASVSFRLLNRKDCSSK